MKNLAALAAILPTSVCRAPGASVAPPVAPRVRPSPPASFRPTRVQRGRSDQLAPPRIADDGTAELGSALFAPPNHYSPCKDFQALVHITAVGYPDHKDYEAVVLDGGDDPVVPGTNAPQALGGCFEDFGIWRSGIFFEAVDLRRALALSVLRESG